MTRVTEADMARQPESPKTTPTPRWRQSLRLRFVLLFMVLALLMTGVFMGGAKRAFTGGWSDTARPLLIDYTDRLAADLGSPPDVARAQALVKRLPITIDIQGPQVQWSSHPELEQRRREWRRGNGDRHRDAEDDWYVRQTADGHRVTFGWAPRLWRVVPHATGWITLAALLLLVALAYVVVRRLLKPLDDIRAGAARFGSGDFATPIPVRRPDDLGALAHRINTMAQDIQAMLDAKRALLLAMSHELRSPLTRARLNAELLPDSPETATERKALLRDLNEMRDLISDLLESERLANPHAALHREPVDLAELLREVVADRASSAGGANVVLDVPDALAPLPLDRSRVRLLVRNLLDNALRYGSGAAQPPRIAVRTEGRGVRIEVRDFGPGVDDAQLERLTEPFFRTDSARQRATGGVGLGMYLCRLVAEAHGGHLHVRNARPGLLVEVLLN